MIKMNNPCPMSWDSMDGNEQERHCTKCERSVFDFTNKSQEEIISILENSEERICAKVSRFQLSPIKKIAATVLISGILAGACTPKYAPYHSNSESSIEMPTEEIIPSKNGNVRISGKVIADNEPLIGATIAIVLKDKPNDYTNAIGTVTEYDGTFSLVLEESLRYNPNQYELVISYTGFQTFSISLEKVNMKNGLIITLGYDIIIGELLLETKSDIQAG